MAGNRYKKREGAALMKESVKASVCQDKQGMHSRGGKERKKDGAIHFTHIMSSLSWL